MTVDVLVIGAGAAGSVVARVLADQGLKVQLLEAGDAAPPESARGPDALTALTAEGWTWPGDYLRGRGLGGGSAINGLVMMAGDSALLRDWAGEQLVSGLNLAIDDLAPVPHRHGPLTSAFRRASRAVGHASAPSSAVLDQTGLMTAALAVADGQRRSVADCYLAEPPDDLEILAGTEVVELIGNGKSVTGVLTADGRRLSARHTVLCAGALVSPRLLLDAGLGNDRVGKGLKDHPSAGLTVSLADGVPADVAGMVRPPVTAVLRWSSGRDANDLLTVPVESAATSDGYGLFLNAAMAVASEGQVTADGFSFGRLEHADDRFRLRAAVRGAARLLRSPEMAESVGETFIDAVGTTLDQLPSDDSGLDAWMMDAADGLYHAGCSCRLGDVVGDGGRVLEAAGVSVIDASVLPELPRANPQLTVMAVASQLAGELAASL